MAEIIGGQLSPEEVVSSMVNVETPGGIPLEQALERIGYEMSTEVREDKRIIWVKARSGSPSNRPSVALELSVTGIYHAPQFEYPFDHEDAPQEALLTDIHVSELVDEIEFIFEGVADPNKMRFITLSTKYRVNKWGAI